MENLFCEVCEIVSEYKAPFMNPMSMQIHIIKQLPALIKNLQNLLNPIDLRMPLQARCLISSIQVLITNTHPVMPVIHPIRIYHRH